VFIAYATDSGSIAQDGEGKHSPFTQALLRNLQKPISIDDMFSLVTKEVRLITKHKQRPYKYASLESIVCLAGNCSGTPTSDSEVDPIEFATRSEAQELQIALQTKNSDALETYLQKYPETSRQIEVREAISSLKRSEFDEWTLFEVSNQKIPHFMKLSTIDLIENRVAVRQRIIPEPPITLGPKVFADAAYVEMVTVFDCQQPRTAIAEHTVFNKLGEVLSHYSGRTPAI
jgi:hypothetical protein